MAIKIYYDSRRRNWKESNPAQKNMVEIQTKQHKFRSRRDRIVLIIYMHFVSGFSCSSEEAAK